MGKPVAKAVLPAVEKTRTLTVLAEDPSVLGRDGKPLLTTVRIPDEPLLPGPRGSRIEVIDYDATSGKFYTAADISNGKDLLRHGPKSAEIDRDPRLHAQHVYGVVAATLFEFERALGRSLSWGFDGGSHQLKIAPHAFEEANAFYSREDEALLFGYFQDGRTARKKTVFTCLSHDIVAHEATHALLDGLRDQLTRPSHPQQEAFHEGYADIIALLSVLRGENLIQHALESAKLAKHPHQRINIDKTLTTIKNGSVLTGLARQMGNAVGEPIRRDALRRSIHIKPNPTLLQNTFEPHDLGEILVAIVLQAYFKVWESRLCGKLKKLSGKGSSTVEAWRVAEEGAKAAQHLLTMSIRAIDYMPCVHITFEDFLRALITSDWQTCPDDQYGYRGHLLDAFAGYGIIPSEKRNNTGIKGTYGFHVDNLRYGQGTVDSLQWDCDGMFRFIWQNRIALGLVSDAYTKVNSVRSLWRVAPHGQIVRETVAEFYQLIKQADITTLRHLGVTPPAGMKKDRKFDLVGGGILVFDEFGSLKFYISNHINSKRQSARIAYLDKVDALTREAMPKHGFAVAHQRRAGLKPPTTPKGGYF
jgi:hypothetical protein